MQCSTVRILVLSLLSVAIVIIIVLKNTANDNNIVFVKCTYLANSANNGNTGDIPKSVQTQIAATTNDRSVRLSNSGGSADSIETTFKHLTLTCVIYEAKEISQVDLYFEDGNGVYNNDVSLMPKDTPSNLDRFTKATIDAS